MDLCRDLCRKYLKDLFVFRSGYGCRRGHTLQLNLSEIINRLNFDIPIVVNFNCQPLDR